MKSALFSLCLSALAILAGMAHAQERQTARITAVAIDSDKRMLVVRYEVAGTASEERIAFPHEIADFRYCRWVGDSGIAVVARTGEGEAAEYLYTAFYFSKRATDHIPLKIRTPKGRYTVLGIGSPGGDTVVITAFQPNFGPVGGTPGWIYKDGCPQTAFGDFGREGGFAAPFTVPTEPIKPK